MIYIHIGKPKTGTTTIQRYLYLNKNRLLEKAYLYPSAGIVHWGHHNIYYDLAQSPEYDLNWGGMSLLVREIKLFKEKHPSGSIILSSETLAGAYTFILQRLLDTLKEFDEVRCILYLRNQFDYLKSFWSLDVRNAQTQFGFKKWGQQCIATNHYGADYKENIEQLTSVINKDLLKIVVYDDIPREQFVERFLSICEINDSRDFLLLDKVSYNVSEINKFPGSEDIQQQCKDYYADGNAAIAKEYLDRDYLFKDFGS